MSAADPRVVARAALAAYLTAELASDWSDVRVSENWPTPQTGFPKRALTVLAPRVAPLEVAYHAPVIWGTTDTTPEPTEEEPDPAPTGTVLYSYGRATYQLQLDVWAEFEAVRDQLQAVVQTALNRNPLATLPSDPAAVPCLDAGPGLVLELDDFYGVTCEYRFDPVPLLAETPPAAMAGDWRATWSGTATVYLMTEQAVALMKSITLRQTINGGSSEDVPLATP